MDKKTSRILNFIGRFAIVAGVLVGLWLITAGLYCVLWAYDTNKDISVLILFAVSIIFSVLLIVSGVGVLRRKPRARALLVLCCVLAYVPILAYIYSEVTHGLSSEGIGYFWSWLGGIAFWLFILILDILMVRFLNSKKTKELFLPKMEE